MNIESFRDYCLSKKGVTEETPFGEDTLVYKVMGKMYALTGLNSDPFRFNLKCDPDRALELRDEYEDIIPGYHMSKKHWNTVIAGNNQVPEKLQRELIDHSYELVVSSLTKKLQQELKEL